GRERRTPWVEEPQRLSAQRLDAGEVRLLGDLERLRSSRSSVEAEDGVEDALADPLVAGDRDQRARLDRLRLVAPCDAIRHRVDAKELPIRLEHPDRAVSGRDRSRRRVPVDDDLREA